MSTRPARFDGIPIKVGQRVLACGVIVYLSLGIVDSESESPELIWQSLPFNVCMKLSEIM